ncbi:hypothetical protein KI387_027598, partial [Taxus chinensis]
YNQIWLVDEDKHKTTFTMKWGTFACAKMPFRLSNVGSNFQRSMDATFVEMINKIILIYLDDLTVFTKMKEDRFDALEV